MTLNDLYFTTTSPVYLNKDGKLEYVSLADLDKVKNLTVCRFSIIRKNGEYALSVIAY